MKIEYIRIYTPQGMTGHKAKGETTMKEILILNHSNNTHQKYWLENISHIQSGWAKDVLSKEDREGNEISEYTTVTVISFQDGNTTTIDANNWSLIVR